MSRIAVVTGGATGIGRQIAARFVADGLSVVITGRCAGSLAETADRLGPRARAVPFDASAPDEVHAALADLPHRVDVLVNNAGAHTDLHRPLPDPGDLHALRASWLANIEANLISAVLVTAALQPRFAGHGRIVSIGSIAAKAGNWGYGAAKAALETWNRELACHLGSRGVTANIVSPGLVENTGFRPGGIPAEHRARQIARTATGRAAQPGDVAAAVAFLASAEAGHITGQILHVNGGAHLGT
ncbi:MULTISPECIES: SDR family NAD(P)-dependent oxidoreductase [Streptomyces]|uniref:SDR family NAD(P)-dependent oxidoreductase n=1 Tax=Streptomyces ramulosus TaxID=47762 RepID=A0ABW1FE08_9ACTN